MERWMQVHGVRTREEWEAQQPKPQRELADQYDAWCMTLANGGAPTERDAQGLAASP